MTAVIEGDFAMLYHCCIEIPRRGNKAKASPRREATGKGDDLSQAGCDEFRITNTTKTPDLVGDIDFQGE